MYSDAELAQILDKDIFHRISEVADSLGVECYVVGGYVRDIFLERPSKDIDVVVVGSGIAVATELKKRLGRRAHLSVFHNFGNDGIWDIDIIHQEQPEYKSQHSKFESIDKDIAGEDEPTPDAAPSPQPAAE